jgi:hypothetical protein
LDKEVLDWLLDGPPWVRYAVKLQLLDSNPDAGPAVKDNSIARICGRLKDVDIGIPALKAGKVHYTENGKAYWDLFFLADIGLTIADLGLEREAEEIFRLQKHDGTFVIPPNVKDNYYCMSAILIASLARMGYRDDDRVKAYVASALSAQMSNGGWDCYGDFGTYDCDSCPMDDLNLLMLLGQYDEHRENPRLNGAIDLLLRHWEERTNLYGFGIGKRFKSLQYPAVKYGILRVIDVLSVFPYAADSRSFQAMLDFVHRKASEGRYRPEAADAAYASLDFGQTSEPSRWLTFLIERVDSRVSRFCRCS